MELRLLVKVGQNDREEGIMWMGPVDPTCPARIAKPATLQWRDSAWDDYVSAIGTHVVVDEWKDVPIVLESGNNTVDVPAIGGNADAPTKGPVIASIR